MQVAADPEHSNKYHAPPSPPWALIKFWRDSRKKKWKSCSLSEPNCF